MQIVNLTSLPFTFVVVQEFEQLPNTLEEIDTRIHQEQVRADCTYQTNDKVGGRLFSSSFHNISAKI